MKRLGLLFLLIALLLGIGAASYFYVTPLERETKNETKTQEAEDLKRTAALIEQEKGGEAIEVISLYADQIQNFGPNHAEWLGLLIDASVQTNNPSQLAVLYNLYPSAFDEREDAVLLVASDLLRRNRNNEYRELRESWDERKNKEKEWFLLDSDSLLLEGKRAEAITLLQSKEFEGKEDVGRLVRLALIYLTDQPNQSWELFTKAAEKDPTNPVIRLYRARLLEGYGQLPLAHLEYLAALQADNQNPAIRDQLAEFYLRYDQIAPALRMWVESLNLDPPSDAIFIKALFWGKVALPINVDWDTLKLPKGPYAPFIRYLIKLPKNQFWNAEEFRKLPDQQTFLTTIQSSFWLRLLEALQEGDEEKASTLLRFNVFKTESWAPDLELALNYILQYRRTGSFALGRDADLLFGVIQRQKERDERIGREQPIFFKELEELAKKQQEDPMQPIPADMQAFLQSDEVFSQAFAHAGWLEAAVILHRIRIVPDDFPSFVAPTFAQTLRVVRGNWEALEYASMQLETDQMTGLIAELLISAGNLDAALDKLDSIRDVPGETGKKATWLISLIYIDKEDFEKAKETLASNPELEDSVLGKETLARIALLENNPEIADRIYRGILAESGEAKSFFARKAFEEENWDRARELTEELIRMYPNNAVLHENLRIIIEKQMEQSERR